MPTSSLPPEARANPKEYPSRRNLNAFYTAYHRLGWQLDENDRMLQMFELTFDVSIVSFLYPLTLGACIYTVSPEGVKYINVIETLEKYDLTFAAVAPSLLQLLRPYFPEIHLPALRYLVVTAEASDAELLDAFRKCVPNASFINLYGPTEGTIYCTPDTRHLLQASQRHDRYRKAFRRHRCPNYG
jgi:D-alanine--poly(phosphoribitol) ligase subunit 1